MSVGAATLKNADRRLLFLRKQNQGDVMRTTSKDIIAEWV